MPIGPPTEPNPFPEPQTGGLGERLTNGVGFSAGGILLKLFQPLASIGARATEQAVEATAPTVEAPTVGDVGLDALKRAIAAIAAVLWAILESLQGLPLATRAIAFVAALAAAAASGFQKHLFANLLYPVNELVPWFRISAEDGIIAERRGGRSLEELKHDLAQEGVDPVRANDLILRSYKWLSMVEIRERYYRGLDTHDRTRELIKGIGLPDDQVDAILEYWGAQGVGGGDTGVVNIGHLPTPSDMQHFVSRHIFDPTGRELFGRFEPTEDYFQYMALLGFTREIANLYWLAHWDLIAGGQAITAWHRLGDAYGTPVEADPDNPLTTREGVYDLMRFREIYPGYQKPLVDSSWNGVSMFLVRGMLEAQTIDDSVATEFLRWNQVKPSFIPHILDWAHKNKHSANKQASVGLLTTAYKEGDLTQDEYTAHLRAIGYTDDAIAIEIAVADHAVHKANDTLFLAAIRAQHAAGIIDDTEATVQLLELGKTADQVTALLQSWIKAKSAAAPRITTAELLRMYSNRVISEPVLRGRLEAIHTPPDDIELLVLEAGVELDKALFIATRDQLANQRLIHPVPTKHDYAAWLKEGIILPADFTAALLAQGFTQADINRYATQAQIHTVTPSWRTPAGQIAVGTAREQFRAGQITQPQLGTELLAAGVPPATTAEIIVYELAALQLKAAPPPTAAPPGYNTPLGKSAVNTAKTEFRHHNITVEQLRQALLSAGMSNILANATVQQELARAAPTGQIP